MKYGFVLLFGLLFLFTLFAINAEARSFHPAPAVDIVYCTLNEEILPHDKFCLDDNCTIYLSYISDRSELWSLRISYYYSLVEIRDVSERKDGGWLLGLNTTLYDPYRSTRFINWFMDVFERVCEEDPVAFGEAVDSMKGAGLTFLQYDAGLELSWITMNNKLFECDYIEYNAVGGWLVRKPTMLKDYCFRTYLYYEAGMISPTKFFFHLFKNPSAISFLYIVLLIFLLAVLLFALYKSNIMLKKASIPKNIVVWIAIGIVLLLNIDFFETKVFIDLLLLFAVTYGCIACLLVMLPERSKEKFRKITALKLIIAIIVGFIFAIIIGSGISLGYHVDIVVSLIVLVILLAYYSLLNYLFRTLGILRDNVTEESKSRNSRVVAFLRRLLVSFIIALFFGIISFLHAIPILMIYYWIVELLAYSTVSIEKWVGMLSSDK